MNRGPRRGVCLGTSGLALSLSLMFLGVTGPVRPARAQSELGRGSGGSVPYPYGNGTQGGRSAAGFGDVAAWNGSGARNPAMPVNPYGVAMMNPFLNPYAALYTDASPRDAALYFFAAQQSMGGIGAGQISGSRPRPSSPSTVPAPGAAPAPAAATAGTGRRVSDRPGSGAARYFNRGPTGGAAPASRYNRYGNYYSANGH